MLKTITYGLVISLCAIGYLWITLQKKTFSPAPPLTSTTSSNPPTHPDSKQPSSSKDPSHVLGTKQKKEPQSLPSILSPSSLNVQRHGVFGQSPTALKQYATQLRWTSQSLLTFTHQDYDLSVEFKVSDGLITQALFSFPPLSSSMMAMDIWSLLIGNETETLHLPEPLESPHPSSHWTSTQTLPSRRTIEIDVQYRSKGYEPYGPKVIRVKLISK